MEWKNKRLPLTLDEQKQLLLELAGYENEDLPFWLEKAAPPGVYRKTGGARQCFCSSILLEACPSFLVVFDTELHYKIGTGKLLCENFGFSDPAELNDLLLDEVFRNSFNNEWVAIAAEKCRDVTNGRESLVNYNEHIDFFDGRGMYVNIYISPVFNENKAFQGVYFLMHDITEMAMMKEKAEAASKAKSYFLTNISHEIRTPMNAVLGMSNLLNMTPLNELQKDYVKNILTASDSLLQIINDILDFSKIDTETLELVMQNYSVADMISDIANVANLRAMEKNLSFLVDVDPSLPSVLIGDELRVKQILTNILNNSVKNTRTGSVKLCVGHEDVSDGALLTFTVSDTGTGIVPESIGDIFKMLSQSDVSAQHRTQSTGLSIAIGKNLAEAMGGSLTVKGEQGVGTVFVLKIPQKVFSAEPIITINEPGKKRVLLLSGNMAGDLVEGMLNKLFLQYDYIKNSEYFLEYITKNNYTHIIYWYDLGDQIVRENIGKLTNVVIVAVKDLGKIAIQETSNHIETLFEPVLITNIAKYLNLKPSEHNKQAEDETLGSFQVHDVRALLVDDNDINLMVAEELLKHYNIEVDSADSGQRAIELASQYSYDIIFMDHMMPEMDGVETTARIRKLNQWCSQVPIVALTANAIVGIREFLMDNLMDDYLSKPIEIKGLNSVLAKWLPDEKINLKAAGHLKRPAGDEPLPDFLVKIGAECNLDVRYSINALGGNEHAYLSLLNIFVNKAGTGKNSLLRMFNDKSWDDFRINVHGYKSAFYNIGAKALSEEARKLEVAVIRENFDFIKANFFDFIRGMEKMEKRLAALLRENKMQENKIQASAEQKEKLKDRLSYVVQLIDRLEGDLAIEQMNEILRFGYGDAADRLLDSIKVAIESFDYDGAVEYIDTL
ncbi:MAG: response regulator [Acidaminococcales bacterium]|nr:response regulator [Acidaminococcales bacterium]